MTRCQSRSAAEPRPDHVGCRAVTEEISFALKLPEETVGCTFVESGEPRDVLQLQAGGRSIQKLENAKHFALQRQPV